MSGQLAKRSRELARGESRVGARAWCVLVDRESLDPGDGGRVVCDYRVRRGVLGRMSEAAGDWGGVLHAIERLATSPDDFGAIFDADGERIGVVHRREKPTRRAWPYPHDRLQFFSDAARPVIHFSLFVISAEDVSGDA